MLRGKSLLVLVIVGYLATHDCALTLLKCISKNGSERIGCVSPYSWTFDKNVATAPSCISPIFFTSEGNSFHCRICNTPIRYMPSPTFSSSVKLTTFMRFACTETVFRWSRISNVTICRSSSYPLENCPCYIEFTQQQYIHRLLLLNFADGSDRNSVFVVYID